MRKDYNIFEKEFWFIFKYRTGHIVLSHGLLHLTKHKKCMYNWSRRTYLQTDKLLCFACSRSNQSRSSKEFHQYNCIWFHPSVRVSVLSLLKSLNVTDLVYWQSDEWKHNKGNPTEQPYKIIRFVPMPWATLERPLLCYPSAAEQPSLYVSEGSVLEQDKILIRGWKKSIVQVKRFRFDALRSGLRPNRPAQSISALTLDVGMNTSENTRAYSCYPAYLLLC